ncbi:phosphonate transport system substrate-binding protein [Zhongshania antarctica]|jgi:phosphonate transport system substrate-binding protein|uniref:Phosphonate transport system substrate-binding protein n=1 Tax=Zhongshania antarctica TaxID=641702 RepID=A0A840R2E7_9GAMM|nr:phosphate/phosphite/phosphonate ABC transporter substrate-binding protein [Zhongshania antarctica]MBB5186783.1 phosphonate transport system substrate-binding protein [Zhongshania antarctica]
MRAIILALILLQSFLVNAAEYRVGVVPQFEARRLNQVWLPILDELAKRTGDSFVLVTSKSIPEFEASFQRGDFDLAYMNPWHAVVAYETQQYLPIVRDGDRKLKGILVVRKDSGITNVKQLAGAEIAFPAPNALGASLLMRADLKMIHGIDITPKYVDTHSSVYLNVALQSTKAGGGVKRTLKEQAPALQDMLMVLYETRAVNPHPIVVHPRVSLDAAQRISEALLAMTSELDAQKILAEIPMRRAVATNIDEYLPLTDWGLHDFYVPK